jgi:hypothetical protein
MALQTNPALPGLQAYADAAFADNYFDVYRMHTSDWTSATQSDKERALAWAAVLLNNVKFKGSKVNVDDPLDWPRYNVYKSNGSAEVYASDELPILLQYANCELAMHMLEKDRTLLYEENLGLSSLSVGGISLSFDNTRKENTIPSYVFNLLKPVSFTGQMVRT